MEGLITENEPSEAQTEQIPSRVLRVQEFLRENKIWHQLSRNRKATGCREAASVRQCLGQEGIPLSREMKSNLGYFVDEANKKFPVVLHCRGNEQIDFEKVRLALGFNGNFERSVVEEDKSLDDSYGLINPFELELDSRSGELTVQVFDRGLLDHTFLPHTLVTNAGDRTWAVEFQVESLIDCIPNRRLFVDDIVEDKVDERHPNIGILTGNGPESGALLWQTITENVRKLQEPLSGDVYLPKVFVRSAPAMGLTMELRSRSQQVWEEIKPELEALCEQIAKGNESAKNLLAVACNTTPFFDSRIREIALKYDVEYVSIVDSVNDYVDAEQITEFVLLGIGYVLDEDFSGYRRFLTDDLFKVKTLSEDSISRINELAYLVKRGSNIDRCFTKFMDIVKHNTDESGEKVVVALTEISVILEQKKDTLAKWRKRGKTKNDIIDSVDLYGQRIAQEFTEATGILRD